MLNIPFAKVMQQYQSKFMQAQDAKHHEGCEAAIVGGTVQGDSATVARC
jgi:hypothetical protein